jgi:hypothetical protein
MRKVVQPGAESAQDKVLDIQDWILAQRQKVLSKANLNRHCCWKRCWCNGRVCLVKDKNVL